MLVSSGFYIDYMAHASLDYCLSDVPTSIFQVFNMDGPKRQSFCNFSVVINCDYVCAFSTIICVSMFYMNLPWCMVHGARLCHA